MTNKKQFPMPDLKLALKTYGMTVIAAAMAAIVYLSMILVFNGLFTKSVGYTLYEKNEDGTLTEIETHYYEEGEGPLPDLDEAELQANNQTYQIFRSQLEGGHLITYRVLSQLLMALLLWVFPFNLLREKGNQDRTLVEAGERVADEWRGARVGLMAAVPSLIAWVVFVISQAVKEPSAGMFVAYRVSNLAFDPLIMWMMPDGVGRNFFVQLACLLMALSVPAVTTLAYQMGYRNWHPVRNLMYSGKKSKS